MPTREGVGQINHHETRISNHDPDRRIDLVAWLGDQAFGTELECRAPLHPPGRTDRSRCVAGRAFRGIDHPLHPLLIVAAHHLVGGEGPGSWQRAALVLCFTCGVLLVIPIYLLALELFGGRDGVARAAW